MKTNKNHTYEIISFWLMSNNEVNAESLASEVVAYMESHERFYLEEINTRRKTRNVAIEMLMNFINYQLSFNGYSGFYASNQQVMQFDREHGGSLEKTLDIIETEIIETRNEYYN